MVSHQNSRIGFGRFVVLAISLNLFGARPDVWADEDVPSVVGLSAKEAKAAIEAVGLVAEFHLGLEAPSPEKRLTVVEQMPRAGAKLPKSGRVQITVYKNEIRAPQVSVTPGVVPDLTGLSAAEAKRLIERAGLRASFRIGAAAPKENQAFVVSGQQPEPDAEVGDARVEITLYDEAPPSRRAGESDLARVSAVPFVNRSSQTIDPRSGTLLVEVTDLSIPAGAINLEIRRSLKLQDDSPGLLGSRWRLNWEKRLLRGHDIAVIQEDAGATVFRSYAEDENFRSVAGDRLEFTGSEAVRTRADGSRERYNREGQLVEIERDNGNNVSLRYDVDGQLVRIDGPFQTSLRLVSDREGRLTSVRASTGATVRYWYGLQASSGDADPGELSVCYGYNGPGKLTRIVDPRTGTTTLAYDRQGRVIQRRWVDGTFERYEYDYARGIVQHLDPVGRLTSIKRSEDGLGTRVTNPAGLTTTIETDPTGRLVSMEGPTGYRARVHYDGSGRIRSVENSLLGETHFEYEETSHRPTAQVTPEGMRQRFLYDQHNNLCGFSRETARTTESEDARRAIGRSVEAEYLPNGLVKKIVTGDGLEATLTYDERGNVATVTDFQGQTTTFEHDARGNLVRQVDPLGNATECQYDEHNRPTRVAYPDGGFVRFEYSPAGLLVRRTDHKDRTVTFEYDERGRLVQEAGSGGAKQRYAYYPDGQISSVTDEHGNTTTYEYNDMGRLTGETRPTGRRISYRYDKLANLVEWKDNLGASQTIRYDAKGQISSTTDSTGATARVRRDENGKLVRIVDEREGVKQLRYNDARQLVEVEEPNGDRARYEYDEHGRISAIHHPGRGVSKYEYDRVGNLAGITSPVGNTMAIKHDPFGRITSTTDAKGQTTSYTYDRLGRLVRKELADGKTVRYEYDGDGNLVLLDDGLFPVHYAYDEMGNQTKIEYPAIQRTLTYEYDREGRLVAFVNSERRKTKYEYDDYGQLTAIQIGEGKTFQFAYDQAGRRTSIAYPNGVKGTLKYDSQNRVVGVNYVDAEGNAVAGWNYRYDAAGNPVEVVDAEGQTVHYAYDPSGQITEEKPSDGSVVKYTYQAGGNRAARETDGESAVYEYDGADRLLKAGDETLAYDENGNLIERKGPEGVTRYEYDVEDRLVQVTPSNGESFRYGYSPTGERIWREDSKGRTWYVTDGVNLVAELDENLAPQATYLHGLDVDRPLAMSQADEDYFLHADSLGSIRTLTDESGSPAASYAYDAFGRIEKCHGSVECPLAFTGREFDRSAGLYYYRSRYYDPDLGRFLTADTLRGTQADPLSLNRYAYVNNAPTRLVDPMGAAGEKPGATGSSGTNVSGTVENLVLRPIESACRLVAPLDSLTATTQVANRTGYVATTLVPAAIIEANVKAETNRERIRDTSAILGGFGAGYLASTLVFGSNPVGMAAVGAYLVNLVFNVGASHMISEAFKPGGVDITYTTPYAQYGPDPQWSTHPAMAWPVGPDYATGGTISSTPIIPFLVSAAASAIRGLNGDNRDIDRDLYPPGEYPPTTALEKNRVAGDRDSDYRDRAEALVDLVIQAEASRLDRALTQREIAAARQRIRNAQSNWDNQRIYGGNQGYGGYGNQDYWNDWGRQWGEGMFEGLEKTPDQLGGGFF